MNKIKIKSIEKELEELERLEDLAPTNELFYLTGGDSRDITLCHKIRIGQDFFEYFNEDKNRIAVFLSNKKRKQLSFQDHKYICEAPILHMVYNGAPYYIKVEEEHMSVLKKYHIIVADTVDIDQCRVELNRLGSWLHIEHNINFLDKDNLLSDMWEGDLFNEEEQEEN